MPISDGEPVLNAVFPADTLEDVDQEAWVLAVLGRHELHAVIGELGDRSFRSL